MMTIRKSSRAPLSASDKPSLVEFARGLGHANIELVSTGGKRKVHADAGLQVRDISDVTGIPKMLDRRGNSLHPLVHGSQLRMAAQPD